ncbi:unnamed protein product [Lymnaea stagnalis]|uniref:15-oxoprostaglandin 13-reductase n=1 Tax=Lymnaea stagnalis TaxID=6523 RepID=A0AAV2H8G6_LYMST
MGVADKIEKNETKRGSCFNSKNNEDEERKRVSSLTWVKVKQFIGTPRRSDFALDKEELPAIKRKEILLESLCWTTDHYMKIFDVALGSVMVGEQVASVIDTLHEDYPLNALVACSCGWRTHAIVNPEEEPVRRLIDIGNLPASLYLGTLGLPG